MSGTAPPVPGCEYLGDRSDDFFRELCGRRCNSTVPHYMFPADDEEARRQAYFHRLLQFVFEGRNYVGPFKDVLRPSSHCQRRILDVGTGSGRWAIELADEFPHVEVVGVDVAPMQPFDLPPNCDMEICDVDQPALPYPSQHFDVIHARDMHMAIRDYPALLQELTRMLRPGGLLLLVEVDYQPVADGKRAPLPPPPPAPAAPPFVSGAPGWFAAWDRYARALAAQGVDAGVPARLGQMVWQTHAYDMSRTVAHEAEIPIGFHPRADPTLLTVGQLAWMDFDLLVNALRPYLLSTGLSEDEAEIMIVNAQSDLYYPVARLSCKIHVVRGIKK